jgi:hypothetical protein
VLAYRVRSLRLESPYAVSPCDEGTSRWWRVAHESCSSALVGADSALDPYTREAISSALIESHDANEMLKDIDVRGFLAAREHGVCTSSLNGVLAMGAQLTVNGSCWRHVMATEGNVYSFSYWAVCTAARKLH